VLSSQYVNILRSRSFANLVIHFYEIVNDYMVFDLVTQIIKFVFHVGSLITLRDGSITSKGQFPLDRFVVD